MSPPGAAEPTSTRRPVAREEAAGYLTLLVVAFVVTVTVTRLFLALTGYPKIGGSTYHLAHALWGGLLLVVAVVAMLLWANRWALQLGAVLAGVGAGLFIDEVGKFITTSNDYFFSLAMPIIYGFFLVSVMIYLEVRRPQSQDPRAEMYRALETLQELLDRDL